jgi:hypothetical protein
MDEGWTDQNVSKAHHPAQMVEGNLELHCSLYLHLQGFMIQAEISSLGHNEQSI